MRYLKKAFIFLMAFFGVFLLAREIGRIRKAPGEFLDEETTVRRFVFDDKTDIEDWEERVLASGATSYEIAEVDGQRCLTAQSENSASALFYRRDLDRQRAPYLSWEWKAVDFPERTRPENLGEKDEFDFVAQIYVVFDSRFLLNARAIQYLWAEESEEGTVRNSPYTDNIRLVVLRSGLSEDWAREMRDIKEDYEKFFGEELTKDVQAVAIMTDADSTSSEAKALFRNLEMGYLKSEPEKVPLLKRLQPGEVEVKTDKDPRRRGRFLL